MSVFFLEHYTAFAFFSNQTIDCDHCLTVESLRHVFDDVVVLILNRSAMGCVRYLYDFVSIGSEKQKLWDSCRREATMIANVLPFVSADLRREWIACGSDLGGDWSWIGHALKTMLERHRRRAQVRS